MVSTRQMATSGGGGCNGGTLNNIAATMESARLTAISSQTQRGLMIAAPVISAIIATGTLAATTSSTPRQCGHTQNNQSQQQLIEMSDSNSDKIVPELLLFDLPIEILTKIFAYTGYRKVGQLRVVSRKMNDVCMDILNSTFSRLITQTYNRFHAIKANMPRRESARRNHPLACECDIIETCYMRLSLLQMTFGKHIERGHCCFFPGAILDEVYNILNYIRNTPRLERPYRVTDELFDLSTMAMEYFRDRIEQTLPDIAYFNKDFFKLPTTTKRPALVTSVDHADSASSSPPQSNMVLRKGIRKIKQGMKIYNNQLSVLRNELRNCKRKSSEQGKQIAEQQKLLGEQQKQTLEYANRLDENDKKNEEMARKFSTLLQELNKCKTELQYWRSKSPAIPICTACGQKLAPLLPPPEDFQALVNQGVKPEDILLNLSDDTDLENDVDNTAESHRSVTTTTVTSTQASQASVFAYPDRGTTAKLLSISNTVTKNQLKRQHCNTNSLCIVTSNVLCKDGGGNVSSTFQNYASSSHGGISGSCSNSQLYGGNSDNQSGNCNGATHRNSNQMCGSDAENGNAIENYRADDVKNQLLPSEMTNRLSYSRGSNIIRTAASAGCSHNSWCNQQIDREQQATTSLAVKNISEEAASCELNIDGGGGRATKQAYLNTTNNGANAKCTHVVGMRSHRSVIVSPAMLSANKVTQDNVNVGALSWPAATVTTSMQQCNNSSTLQQAGGGVTIGCLIAGKQNGGGGGDGGSSSSGEETAVEHVINLQGITSHETKKARRVQKATRSLNGSGKRSK
ncbi:uncharacterized protein [Eurosta solidaginis]|uniref:uncharacterized protein n=1 Tax=Eurosta solidaginis TaxID=178769 RepID=UPI003530B12D